MDKIANYFKKWLIITVFTIITYKLQLIINVSIDNSNIQIILTVLIVLFSIKLLDLFRIHTEGEIDIHDTGIGFLFAIIIVDLVLMSILRENYFREEFAVYVIRYPSYILIYSGSSKIFSQFRFVNMRMFVMINGEYYIKSVENNKLYFNRFKVFTKVKEELINFGTASILIIVGVLISQISQYQKIILSKVLTSIIFCLLFVIFLYSTSKLLVVILKFILKKGALIVHLDNTRPDNFKDVKNGLDIYSINDLIFYDMDPITPVKLELDKEFLQIKKKTVLLNGKWGVGKTTLIQNYYPNEEYIDVMKYGNGQNNMNAIFKQVCKWYSLNNIFLNVMNIWNNPELLKYVVLANTVLLGSFGVITEILYKVLQRQGLNHILNLDIIMFLLIIVNLMFLQLLPYLVFDNDPKSTKFRKLYLDHIICALKSKILILDNLDRIEYEQLIDILEVINYMNEFNICILILAEKNELLNTLGTSGKYKNLSKIKLESYLRKYFDVTVEYISKSEYYTRETIKHCFANNIRISRWTQSKLLYLFACMPEEFEYRELNEFYNFINKKHALMTIDLLLLIYYDINFSENRIITDERLISEVFVGSSGMLCGYDFANILEELKTEKSEINVWTYLEIAKNQSEVKDRNKYIYDKDMTYENIPYFLGGHKGNPIHIHKVGEIYGDINLRTNIHHTVLLPGDIGFLNKSESMILEVFKIGLFDMDENRIIDMFNTMEPTNESLNVILTVGKEELKAKKKIYKILKYNNLLKRSKIVDVDYNKIWGQFMYEFYFKIYELDN